FDGERLLRGRLFEQGVLHQLLLEELLELQRRELEETDGELEHRRHDEPLLGSWPDAHSNFHPHLLLDVLGVSRGVSRGACWAPLGSLPRERTFRRGRSRARARWSTAPGRCRTGGSARRVGRTRG